jgi:radical SAM superfamily enzyme YgiQ (UPF0313 family)
VSPKLRLCASFSCPVCEDRYKDELLDLMKESGSEAIFMGIESISKENLASMHKKMSLRHDSCDAIENIQSHGHPFRVWTYVC